MKVIKFTVLVFVMIVCGCSPGMPMSEDNLYEDFKNPPASIGTFAKWQWDGGGLTEKEVLNRLDAVKKDGFSGVEIYPLENIDARMLKFTAEAAKKRGLLVDLALSSALTGQDLRPDETSRMITLGKITLSGPSTYATSVSELLRLTDETRPVVRPTKRQLLFLRLIPEGLDSFEPGIKPIDRISPEGSIRFDVPDGNFVFYVGILHENYVRSAGTASNVPVLDVLNKHAVERYLENITGKLRPALDKKLWEYIHAISCGNIDLFSANWTGDFAEQFLRRRGYDVLPYLPVVLDNALPKERTRFYDTARRVRYDFCLTFAELLNENFVQTFREWCRDNGVNSRIETDNINMLYFMKGVAEANSLSPEIPFGENKFLAGGNARLSYLLDNSIRRSQIAVLLPIADIWSDCGLYGAGCDDYIWYLLPLRQALNHNGFTADYITEQILAESTYQDGKLHFGSNTWDAVIIPDVCSMVFPAAKTLRFFAESSGKIAFIGGYPQTAPGFNDLLKRTVAVQITIDHIRKEFSDNAAVFLPPQKDKDNLTSWAADLTGKLGLAPTVKISPVNDNLLFDFYTSDNRDIFFFANTSRSERISFNAQFNITWKIPYFWNIETGARSVFPCGGKPEELDIRLEPLGSLLLVFEPDSQNIP